MTDIPVAPAPPTASRSSIAPARVDAAALLQMTESELVAFFDDRLAAAHHAPTLGLHADGTRAIKSLIGVWLISQAGAVVGRRRLVNLARSDKTLLRSMGGVAKLVRQALNAIAVAKQAG